MEVKLVILSVLLVSVNLSHSGPMVETSHDKPISRLTRREAGLIRLKYQSNAICQEGNDTSCLPDGINSAPRTLVECVAGECVCSDCFMTNVSTGRCRLCSDYPFSENVGACGVDNRRSQRTAFLLSFFLASTGAANFYIGRSDLAGGQLFLLILILAMSYSMCCFPICLACCVSKEEMKGSIFFIIFMLIFVILLLLSSLAIWAWWVADLIIFATNDRLAGNGCELNPNL